MKKIRRLVGEPHFLEGDSGMEAQVEAMLLKEEREKKGDEGEKNRTEIRGDPRKRSHQSMGPSTQRGDINATGKLLGESRRKKRGPASRNSWNLRVKNLGKGRNLLGEIDNLFRSFPRIITQISMRPPLLWKKVEVNLRIQTHS